MPVTTDVYNFCYDVPVDNFKTRGKENIHAWVLEFLKKSGKNKALAKKLEGYGALNYGPIDYPIKRIVNILGPNKSFKFREDEQSLELKVDKMIRDMRAGWQAPPLIATNLWEDYLEIADGGHRYYALERLGIKKHPVIFYFRDEKSLKDFVDKLQQQ